jgi:hypothetical protein
MSPSPLKGAYVPRCLQSVRPSEDEENALTQKSESVEGASSLMQCRGLDKNTCSLTRKHALPTQQLEMKQRMRAAWIADRVARLQAKGKYAKRVVVPSPSPPPRTIVVLNDDDIAEINAGR